MRVTGELVIRSFRRIGLIGGVMGTWIFKFLVKRDEADQPASFPASLPAFRFDLGLRIDKIFSMVS